MIREELFKSRHFRLQEIIDGVFAAIAIPGTGAMGNAGIVDLGNRTLVFDTFYTPQAARDLRNAAEQIFQRPVTLVVNSHGHADHMLGNQEFPDASIIATDQTRQMIHERGTALLEFIKSNPGYPDKFALQIEEEVDKSKREQMLTTLGDYREFGKAVPTLKVTYPNIIFENEITFYGTKRNAKLITYGGGHTKSDAFLYLPGEKIAFMGDLLTVQSHNQCFHGDAEEFVRILKRVEQLQIDVAIPGHGEVGQMKDIKTMREYFEEVVNQLNNLIENGVPLEKGITVQGPKKYSSWNIPDLFDRNIRLLLEQKLSKDIV
ncbi:Glyoxylase, beta-lactamase superfamily II [Paenibacillus sp. yr247]|uniref:MBL fold metallo-hydrolase n=1 Tax=Paenibacillus sp. yr247 TaxID=1761880 RepID=UPI00088E943B|nr:MBL fold metallo-hydrolase [Paenibacillus sp. yr247]SDP24471.1 Glyoxylase, beta-lactamase superfamily II [Paenibacillus sp. yr247]